MLPIVGEERRFVGQGNGSNAYVGVGKGLTFISPLPAQQPGFSGDLRGDGQVLQAVQKSRCPILLAGPETGIYFGEVY
jgi:hypothetical protein